MKLAKILLISPAIAISVALFAALSSFATTYNVATVDELTDAVTKAGDGDEIVLAEATFEISSAITLEAGVTLRGAGARENSIIKVAVQKIIGIEVKSEKAVVKDLTISGATNETDKKGAVVMSAGLLENCVLSGNTHTWPGRGPAALYMTGGRATGCLITGNTCKSSNTGVVRLNGTGAVIDHCRITATGMASNYSYYAPLYMQAGTADTCIIDSNDVGNSTGSTGGIYVTGDDVTVRNCTICKNGGTKRGAGPGGIYWNTAMTGARIVNNIIYGNQTQSGPKDVNDVSTVDEATLKQVFVNNLYEAAAVGTAPQTGDPLFTDASKKDYTLTANSPARNKGTDALGLAETDFAGDKRVMGGCVDIGAYEYKEANISCDFAADATAGGLTKVFSFTSEVGGLPSGSQTYLWTFTNDETQERSESTEANPSFTAPKAGTYSVKLVVTDGAEVAFRERTAYLTVSNFQCSFTVDKAHGLVGSTFSFTSEVVGAAGDVTYLWTFKNGTTGATVTSDEANPEYRPTEFGQISVTLVVTDDLGETSASQENCITVQVARTYVDPDNTNAEFPYDREGGAASNIVDAISACGDGGEVVLARKTFSFAETVLLDRGITLRGAGAREETTLKITSKKIYVVKVSHADAVLKNVTISGSLVGWQEQNGGLRLEGGLVTNVVIRDNVAKGIYAGPAAAVLTGGRLTGSLITGNLGGHAAPLAVSLNGSDANFKAGLGPVMDHCLIVSNSMEAADGSCQGSVNVNVGHLHDCLIAWNTCPKGDTAGIRIGGAGAVVNNCTIADNDSGGASAGGLYWNIQPLARVVNCIVAGNKSMTGNCDWGKSATTKDADLPKVFLNCFFDGSDIGGTNCKVGDPGFKKSTPMDYELTSSSTLARDMGLETWTCKDYNNKVTMTFSISEDDLDFAGNPRIMGDTVDIGAYEYNPNQLACGILIGATEGFLGQTFALTSKVEGVSGPATYAWTITSGDTVLTSAEANPFVTPTVCGRYDAELTVTVGDKTISASKQELFYVAPHDLYVRWDAATPKFPFVSPADATSDPKAAVEAAIDGAMVHVSGTNTVTAMISISRAITLKGETGRDADWIKQTGGERVIYLNNAQAVVRGLTLAGGYLPSQYDHGAGIRIASNGGTVEDCTIRDCKLAHYGYGVGFEIASGAANAVVRRCIIRSNKGVSGTYGGGAYLCAGRVENCLFDNNDTGNGWGSGVAVGTPDVLIANCTIVRNHGENAGSAATIGPSAGIWFDAAAVAEPGLQVVNCLFDGNYQKTEDQVLNWSAHPTADVDNLAAAFTGCAFTAGELPVADDETKARLVADPGFTDDGTYRLTKKTGLRGKGTYQAWMDGTTDLYGLPRVGVQNEVEPGCSAAPKVYGFMLLVR